MTDFKPTYELAGKRIWVAGHQGMVGSAIVRRLKQENPAKILTVSRVEVDLTKQEAVDRWMADNRPDAVFLAAARVGGIYANDKYPADFVYDNLAIATNIIHAAHIHNVEKLMFLGSSCIYPKMAPQPIKESSLLTGPLEQTNEWYAIAKIAGIKLCQAYRKQHGNDFISAMPTNLYGPGDNYHPENSHVIPALIRKAHIAKINSAKSMEIWGTGTARREFLHCDDCADALVFLMKNYTSDTHINVGSGIDCTIEEIAHLVMETVGYQGQLTKDLTKPDGMPRKLMDASQLQKMGWTPKYGIKKGLQNAYQWFLEVNKS
jgi:GDP-L-fucose synthase